MDKEEEAGSVLDKDRMEVVLEHRMKKVTEWGTVLGTHMDYSMTYYIF